MSWVDKHQKDLINANQERIQSSTRQQNLRRRPPGYRSEPGVTLPPKIRAVFAANDYQSLVFRSEQFPRTAQ